MTSIVTILVLIVWSSGGPVAGAEVIFIPGMDGVGEGHCVTGADGRCSIEVSVPGLTGTLRGILVVTLEGREAGRLEFFWRAGQSRVGPVEIRLSGTGQVERPSGVETPPTPVAEPGGEGTETHPPSREFPTPVPPATSPVVEPTTTPIPATATEEAAGAVEATATPPAGPMEVPPAGSGRTAAMVTVGALGAIGLGLVIWSAVRGWRRRRK